MKFSKTKEVLNQLTADLSQTSAIIHQIHWYMRGSDFKWYHEQMDEYRDQVEAQLDDVAERLIIIDGAPVSTLEEFIETTNIKSVEGSFEKSIDDHLSHLVDVFKQLAEEYDRGIEIAAEEGEAVSEDIFIAAKAQIELNIWMLQADLNKAPGIDA